MSMDINLYLVTESSVTLILYAVYHYYATQGKIFFFVYTTTYCDFEDLIVFGESKNTSQLRNYFPIAADI